MLGRVISLQFCSHSRSRRLGAPYIIGAWNDYIRCQRSEHEVLIAAGAIGTVAKRLRAYHDVRDILFGMIEFGFPLIISAFLAGVAMFFAPCTLPLVPAFLATVAGVNPASLIGTDQGRAVRWQILKTTVAFVVGFSAVFIVLGLGVTAIGQISQVRIWVQRLAGVAMVIFGATLLGLFRLPSFETKLPLFSNWREKLPLLHSAFVGAAFGLTWSPCIGPIFGSVLFLAAGSSTLGQGTFLLFVFALGQAIPFILSALFIGHLVGSITRWAKVAQIINRIAGAVLVIFGILLMSNLWFQILGWLGAWATSLPGYETFVNQFL